MRGPAEGPNIGRNKRMIKLSFKKMVAGWKHGVKKDAKKKEHPCMIPYDDLPLDQRVKDALFVGVVKALRVLLPGNNKEN